MAYGYTLTISIIGISRIRTERKAIMKSANLDKIAPALTKAQAEMPAVPMDGYNPYFKSKYATLGAVIAATKPILSKHGLSVIQQVISNDQGDAVGIRTQILHESGQFMSWDAVVKINTGNNPGQEAGKLLTYLRRYSLSAALNLYADEDIDANTPKQNGGKVSQSSDNNKAAIMAKRKAETNKILDDLGYKPNNGPMTMGAAGKVKDSKGTPYIDIDSQTLSYKSGAISKAINNNGHDQERKAELETKLKAIKTILKSRSAGEIDEPIS